MELKELYEKVRKLDITHFQKMASLQIEERAEQEPGWTLMGTFKKIIGVLMMLAILKMILFPAQAPPTEAELLKEAQSNIQLTQLEIIRINEKKTQEE